jgi:hypothetical protein
MYIDYGEISQSYISSGRSLDAVASFRVMQIMRARKIQVDHTSVPEWNLNNKIRAYNFVDLLGICRPKVISSGVRAEEILLGKKLLLSLTMALHQEASIWYSSKTIFSRSDPRKRLKVGTQC